jgi:two-component system response regulator DevR
MTSVFLVDDHEIVRRGIADLINREGDLEVVGEAANIRQALVRIAATSPDIAVLDVRLPDGSGIDLCRDIRSEHPNVACLMFTGYDDDEASYTAVLAGAAGYVLKDIRGQNLIDSIRRVARGEILIERSIPRRILDTIQTEQVHSANLSLREKQVLELIAEGLSNRQIGERLGLAEKTVKNYVSGLLSKLGMERRSQAAVYQAKRPSQH